MLLTSQIHCHLLPQQWAVFDAKSLRRTAFFVLSLATRNNLSVYLVQACRAGSIREGHCILPGVKMEKTGSSGCCRRCITLPSLLSSVSHTHQFPSAENRR